ncbi:C-C motif chemokine 4-like [Patagioenas fasciata monilis]|uniref:C-C motif chemokine n=1 Tax=Patagioenas fasciata monilis TaxID=372326 RepID=A0A1V4K4M2_PATFA|nr:C-C motif chemokine 4-like [Patagioenas fasciata monilis]
MEMLAVTLKMRQEGLQEQGEEEDAASEDQDQIICETRAETGISGKSRKAGSDLPICCFSYTRHKLPWKIIQRYYSTSTSCTHPAIVFITKKGRQVCANPSDPWVQSYLQNLKQN